MLYHVSLVPQPSSTGEQKSKPTQHSVRELRGLGLSPDVIVCRSRNPLQEGIQQKTAMFCHVPVTHVLAVHDVSSIYKVPILMAEQVGDCTRRLEGGLRAMTRLLVLSGCEPH